MKGLRSASSKDYTQEWGKGEFSEMTMERERDSSAWINDDIQRMSGIDYEEDETADDAKLNEQKKGGTYSGIHASGFRDFLLKAELLRAVVDCGFEHPSEVQHECIPQAILGMDVLCQAKSGMGKTAVFVLACLQQPDSSEKVA